MTKPCKRCGGTERTKSRHCRQCKNEYARKWRERNPKYHRRWRDRNPEYFRKWRDRNPEYHKNWWKDNPRAAILRARGRARRRARLAGVPHETYDRVDILGTHCLRCGTMDNLTLDHVIPISRGGPDIVANLQTLCLSCNTSKGNRSCADYRTQEHDGTLDRPCVEHDGALDPPPAY